MLWSTYQSVYSNSEMLAPVHRWIAGACIFFTWHKINIKRSPNAIKLYRDFLWTRWKILGPGCTWGESRGGDNPLGRARGPRHALEGCAHLGCPPDRLFALWIPQKSQNPRGVDENSSSHHRVQNYQIQSRHHHGGVHHFHWRLSDDVWVVLCRPSGP